MDEYVNEIFMGGYNTIALHNTCEDSLLAAPLIIDLLVLAELFERINYKTEKDTEFQKFHPVCYFFDMKEFIIGIYFGLIYF